MDAAEKVAAQYSDMVYLGVGLHEGYGSAQRMYVKRGYIPDGTGVWYGEKVCPQYADCCNDDDLVLYFSKASFPIISSFSNLIFLIAIKLFLSHYNILLGFTSIATLVFL